MIYLPVGGTAGRWVRTYVAAQNPTSNASAVTVEIDLHVSNDQRWNNDRRGWAEVAKTCVKSNNHLIEFCCNGRKDRAVEIWQFAPHSKLISVILCRVTWMPFLIIRGFPGSSFPKPNWNPESNDRLSDCATQHTDKTAGMTKIRNYFRGKKDTET